VIVCCFDELVCTGLLVVWWLRAVTAVGGVSLAGDRMHVERYNRK